MRKKLVRWGEGRGLRAKSRMRDACERAVPRECAVLGREGIETSNTSYPPPAPFMCPHASLSSTGTEEVEKSSTTRKTERRRSGQDRGGGEAREDAGGAREARERSMRGPESRCTTRGEAQGSRVGSVTSSKEPAPPSAFLLHLRPRSSLSPGPPT
ncbi:hypothetical protein BJY59DRAFT_500453 [Rhodotorula toruloides]